MIFYAQAIVNHFANSFSIGIVMNLLKIYIMKIQNAKFDYFNLTPLIILLWCLFSFLFKPIIPIASGFGWDGVFYGKVAMDFQNMIGNIDSYHATRIFPGVLIHYFFRIFDLPLNLKSVLLGYRIYNIIILVGSAIFWVLITKRLSLNPFAKWIGFCALFINYPLLNFHFYCPALTDGTAFFIGILMLYSYLERNNILLLIVTMISFFTWPAGIIVGFILFVYSNAESVNWYYKQKKTSIFVFLLLLSPFLAFIGLNFAGEIKHLIVLSGLDGKIVGKFNNPVSYTPVNLMQLMNAIFLAVYLIVVFWYALKNFDLIKFITSTFKKRFIPRLLVSILILVILIILKRLIYSPNLPTLTPLGYFSAYFAGANVRFPLQFIVCQISYWGPIIILFILFFKDFITQLQKFSLPIMLGFLFTVLFSINSDSRPIINFYPFIVVVLLQAVDFSKFKNVKLFAILFFVISLLYSKVWLPIELPSSIFPDLIWTDLDKFPMQWHFMNCGLFMNSQMYWIHAIVAAIFLVIFWFIIKKPKQISL
jgi:hypothetical protein